MLSKFCCNFRLFVTAAALFLMGSVAFAAPDPNFHIYIAFGQSNMAGAGKIRNGVDNVEHPRYKMFATTACNGVFYPTGLSETTLRRPTVGEIYPAVPPMFHCGEGLSVADWFGRYMADSLPGVTVGVIPVAVGGTKIELFDKDKYEGYLASLSAGDSYIKNWAEDYGEGGNAFGRIVEVARIAQQVGVIKGIIFHQGESGSMQGNDWNAEVKKIRDDIFKELKLRADSVPFLAGELEDQEAGGCCWSFTNDHIRLLPNQMENTYVVSSAGLTGNGIDAFHFGSASYQEFGRRYAEVMLKHANVKAVDPIMQQPFNENKVPWPIPGKIQAEDFDEPGVGTGNDSYYDKDAINHGDSDYRDGLGVDIYEKPFGKVVGYSQNGEWLEYSVDIEKAGDYTMFVSGASNNETSGFKISLDGVDITDVILVPKTVEGDGVFEAFEKFQVNVSLPAGKHVMRFTVVGDWIDVDYFAFALGKNAVEPESWEKPFEENLPAGPDAGKNPDGEGALRLGALPFKKGLTTNYDVFGASGKFLGSFVSVPGDFGLVQGRVRSLVRSNGVYFVKLGNGRMAKIVLK